MPTFDQILTWAKDNELLLGLIASAAIGTMPETLPQAKYIHQWLWTWFHDAAKTFLNFRRGLSSPLPADSVETNDKNKNGKKELPQREASVVQKVKTTGHRNLNGTE